MTRPEAQRRIEALGGRVDGEREQGRPTTSWSARTPGSKLAKAEKLGVALLDEDAFRKLVGA